MAAPFNAILVAIAASVTAVPVAAAQHTNPSDWSRPYGQAPGQETRPYAGTRSAGNRVVINGIIQTGVGVSAQANAMASATASVNGMGGVGGSNGGAYGPFASAGAFAVGNQLNVVVNGNYNTVVINSNQTNTGNVTANANANASGNQAGESDNDPN